MKKRVESICIVCCISGIYVLLCNLIINCIRPITYQSITNKMIFEIHSSTSSDNETFQRLQQSQVSLDDEFLLTHPVFKEFNITPPIDKRFVHLLVIVTTGPQRHDRRKAIRDTWWTQCKNQVRNWFKL